MININEIMFFGRFYEESENLYDVLWWLCPEDYKIYHTEDLMKDFHYKSVLEIGDSLNFIPFFKTNIVELEKAFIEKLNNKTLYKKFERILADNAYSYDVSFSIFIEREFLTDSWREFEKKKLRNDAIAWCKENHVPYTEC